MTDCSQLQAQLDNALQEEKQLPSSIKLHCLKIAGNDGSDTQEFDADVYKMCLRSQHQMRMELDLKIAELEQNIAFCKALIGEWDITVRDAPLSSGILIITTWDTDGPFTGRITLSSGEVQTISGSYSSFHYFNKDQDHQFNLGIDEVIYNGTLNIRSQPPTMSGLLNGVYDPSNRPSDTAAWTARKINSINPIGITTFQG